MDLDDGIGLIQMNLLKRFQLPRRVTARGPASRSATNYAAALSIEGLYAPAVAKTIELGADEQRLLSQSRQPAGLLVLSAQRRILQRAAVKPNAERPRQRS